MPTPLRRRFRLARRGAWYLLAIGLVLLALLVGGLSQLLPLAEKHPDRIAAWLSERAGKPVHFEQLRTQWTRRGPLLRLDGLRVGEGEGIRIGEAEVLVSLYAGVLPGRSFTELRLRGLSLTLQRNDAGQWSVRGLPGGGEGDPLDSLQQLGELQVIGGSLTVDAPSLGVQAQIPRIDLRMRMKDGHLRAGARGWLRDGGAPVVLTLDFDRKHGSGRAYLEAARADLDAWKPLLHFAGVHADSGHGHIRAWADLSGHRVIALIADAQVEQLVLRGAAMAPGQPAPTLQSEQLRLRARWRLLANGWRLDVPLLHYGSRAAPHKLDGLLLAGGQCYALVADELDASPLLEIAALSDRLDLSLRTWLQAAAPKLRLEAVRVAGEAGGALRMSGRLQELGFAPVGDKPGMNGLHGDLEGDAQGVALTLAETPLRFDWPSGFGVVHDVRLDGQLVGWREGVGWRIATPKLRIRGSDYGAEVRGGLWFQGDGTRPWIDLAADIDDAPVPAAKKFWVHSHMSGAAVDWLDSALLGGTVTDGHALASGDLDDWPFDRNNGRFEASARIVNGRIRFQPGWPVLEQMQADVTFIANGFSLEGSSLLAGVPIRHVQADMSDFGDAPLRVKAQSQAEGAKLLAMLKQSPLQQKYAETLDNLQVSGPALVNFDMQEGFGHPGLQDKLGGTVALQGAHLQDKRWELAFDNVRGIASYNDSGFAAEPMSVLHNGQPGVLSLRAGGDVRDPQQAFEAELVAALDASDLLDRAPEMAWLKPYVQGRSDWSVGVTIAHDDDKGVAMPNRLRLHSNLVGTALSMPAPLDKPAGKPLPTTVTTNMPLGSGLIDVDFDNILALRAAQHNGQTGVRVVMGKGSVGEAPPPSGMIITGRTSQLDAIEWIGLARSSGGGDNDLPLRKVDVSADQLMLLGGVFPSTRLQLQPVAGALAVNIDGPALAGTLSVPQADGAPVSGHFSRVYWQSATTTAPSVAASTATVDADAAPAGGIAALRMSPATSAMANGMDPGTIPALALDIDDLRLGDALLGSAVLRTRRVPMGLRLQQLQLSSPKQKIDITGSWLSGAQARTRLNAQVDSRDLGQLGSTLGLGEQVRGGHGQVTFDASWPGSPAAFQLEKLQGSLQVAGRDGQLLEVEPGAGRVLGLLSVTQLPRRMMLDFRDFFSKGLAFNRLEGRLDFGDGLAHSDNLLIDGPAAQIRIRGSTDLHAQEFDQTVEVMPKSGNLLPVVGAMAGGPVGAAVGAAANAVLRKPLSEIGAKTYHVTGPWKDPKVEVISREQSRGQGEATQAPEAAQAPEIGMLR